MLQVKHLFRNFWKSEFCSANNLALYVHLGNVLLTTISFGMSSYSSSQYYDILSFFEIYFEISQKKIIYTVFPYRLFSSWSESFFSHNHIVWSLVSQYPYSVVNMHYSIHATGAEKSPNISCFCPRLEYLIHLSYFVCFLGRLSDLSDSFCIEFSWNIIFIMFWTIQYNTIHTIRNPQRLQMNCKFIMIAFKKKREKRIPIVPISPIWGQPALTEANKAY